MFDTRKRLAAGAASLLLGLGAAGFAVGAGEAGSSPGPLNCIIEATSADGMIALAGVVSTDKPVSGSYSFKVAGRGTDIEQGGAFTAGPGQRETLGQVMLGSSGVTYDASLKVTVSGKTVTCTKRVGSAI